MSSVGAVWVHCDWRGSFGAMVFFGIVLVSAYWSIVTEGGRERARRRAAGQQAAHTGMRTSFRALLSGLFSCVSVVCAYVGSGLQLFIMGSVVAWMPTFLNRYYALAPDRAAAGAAVFLPRGGVGLGWWGGLAPPARDTPPHRQIVHA